MSRAFVKEGDQEEVPIIPPRAPLPPGVTNYVTPNGMQQLLDERKQLEEEKANLKMENETELRIASTVLNGRIQLLQERLTSAVVLNPNDYQKDEVRFGAHVAIKVIGRNQVQKFQIVGVDEADVRQQKIAFTAPISVAITGKKVGETAQLHLGREIRQLQILDISW
jgi:transcription elongation factor GreB